MTGKSQSGTWDRSKEVSVGVQAVQRHEAILGALRAEGSIRVSEVAERLGVSTITIRRDVESLARQDRLVRVHGGATVASPVRTGTTPEGITVGMVVPSAAYYFGEIIRGAREAVTALGGRLMLRIAGYHDPAAAEQDTRHLLDSGVDGLLLSPGGSGRAGVADVPVPVVLVERRAQVAGDRTEHVVSDHEHGAGLAVRHLMALGHDRIGLVAREDSPTTPWIRRGYEAALDDAGSTSPLHLATPPPGADGAYERRLETFVDAIADANASALLIHNDHDAVQLVQRLRARGMRVPADVAVVAYDDEVAALAEIPLTAVAPPKHAVGAAAVDLLARRIAEPDRPAHRICLLPELQVRSSCGATSS